MLLTQGENNLTEMYSAIEAEVPLPEDPRTLTNFELVGGLKRAGKVIIGGQALSHCVNYTTRDLLRYWAPRDPADLVLLLDGTWVPCILLSSTLSLLFQKCRLAHTHVSQHHLIHLIHLPYGQAVRRCLGVTLALTCSWMTCELPTSP